MTTIFIRRNYFSLILSVVLSFAFVLTVVNAGSTISTNITTAGNLSVGGNWTISNTATTTVTFSGSAGINFDSNTFVIDPMADRVAIGGATPTVALDVTGTTTSSLGMQIGSSGSGISNILFGTCQINFPSIAPGVDAVDTCAATGTALGDRVFVTPILPDGLVFFSASSTGANAIQVAVINSSTTVLATAPSINPQAQQWSWMAIR